MSKYFSDEDTSCQCGCGQNNVNPILIEKLEAICDSIGVTLELSFVVRCEDYNREVGAPEDSQHILGNAADVFVPNFLTIEQLASYAEEAGMDGIGIYYDSGIVHMDVRDGGDNPGCYKWTDRD